MTTTARQIITSALSLRLNRLSPGEALDADLAALCLSALNEVLDGLGDIGGLWRIVMAPAAVSSLPAVLGDDWPTIAPGAEILGVTVYDQRDIEIEPITVQQWHERVEGKASTGRPELWAYDGASHVLLWPIPTGHVVTLRARMPVSAFADLDSSHVLPAGYAGHLSALLAEAVAEVLTGTLSAVVVRAAAMARRAMRSRTVVPAILQSPYWSGQGPGAFAVDGGQTSGGAAWDSGPAVSTPDVTGGLPMPDAPTVDAITMTTAVAHWPAIPYGATGLEWRLGSAAWAATSGSVQALSGLTPSTAYSVSLRATTTDGAASVARVVGFTTAAEVVAAPAAASVGSVTATGAVVTWPALPSGSVTLQGRVDAESWATVTPGATRTLSGLSASSSHTVEVRAVGTYGAVSGVTLSTFSTLAGSTLTPVFYGFEDSGVVGGAVALTSPNIVTTTNGSDLQGIPTKTPYEGGRNAIGLGIHIAPRSGYAIRRLDLWLCGMPDNSVTGSAVFEGGSISISYPGAEDPGWVNAVWPAIGVDLGALLYVDINANAACRIDAVTAYCSVTP